MELFWRNKSREKKSNQDFGNALPLHGGAIAASIARMEVGTWKQRFPRP